jgi:hypothetical protein
MPRTEALALPALQAQLQRLITEPEGVEASLAAAGAAGGPGLAELVHGDRAIPPAARVAVYANAFFARLHGCLREDFGALARALGPAAFHDLVKTYLMVHPPRHPSLRHAGAHLADHLSAEPFAEIFSRRCSYAADLARLEWAIAEVFYAADVKPLARGDLAAIAPGGFAALRFEMAPALRLLACGWPVHRVRERFEREDDGAAWDAAPDLTPEPTWLCVFRPAEQVRYRALDRLEHTALAAACAGEPFDAICERLVAEVGDAHAAPRAAAFLASWVGDGLIVRV